jgi:low affinity Fe/Cu permease
MPQKKGIFTIAAEATALWMGKPSAFILSVFSVILWAVCGPFFHYSDTWQLVINTGTTVLTFLAVFLIQNTQNRDAKAVHLKLDELIRATKGAHTVLLDLEELNDKDLEDIYQKYEKIAAEGRRRLKAGKSDMNIPKVLLNEKLGGGKKPKKRAKEDEVKEVDL